MLFVSGYNPENASFASHIAHLPIGLSLFMAISFRVHDPRTDNRASAIQIATVFLYPLLITLAVVYFVFQATFFIFMIIFQLVANLFLSLVSLSERIRLGKTGMLTSLIWYLRDNPDAVPVEKYEEALAKMQTVIAEIKRLKEERGLAQRNEAHAKLALNRQNAALEFAQKQNFNHAETLALIQNIPLPSSALPKGQKNKPQNVANSNGTKNSSGKHNGGNTSNFATPTPRMPKKQENYYDDKFEHLMRALVAEQNKDEEYRQYSEIDADGYSIKTGYNQQGFNRDGYYNPKYDLEISH